MKCTRCGECCGLVPFSEKELEVIKKHTSDSFKFVPFINNSFVSEDALKSWNDGKNPVCPYLDGSKKLKCTIYDLRPKMCRLYGTEVFVCPKMQGLDSL